MRIDLSQQARVAALAALLGLTALAVGAFVFLRPHGSSTATVAPTPAQQSVPATTTPKPQTPTRPVHTATPATGLPHRVAAPLDAGRVVVVALVAPDVKLDDAALSEAKDGARRAHAAFVSIDVNTKQVDALNARFGAFHDPAVLVLKPPADLVVRIDGFADRDTVAQAATNAEH